MMQFREWIQTQDPTKWDLDEASINSITEHFYYREICDDIKMDLFFWRELADWRERYKEMVRLETIEIDPLVNRYFEGQMQSSDSGTSASTETSSETESGTMSKSGSVESSGTETGTSTGSDNVTLNKNGTSTETGSSNDQTSTHGNTSGSNSVSSQTEGHTETTESGTSNTETESTTNRDIVTKNVNKQLPMSTYQVSTTGGRIGNLDFTFASDMSMSDVDDDTTVSSTEGVTTENSSESTNSTDESRTEQNSSSNSQTTTETGSTSKTGRTTGSETTHGTKSSTDSSTSAESSSTNESGSNSSDRSGSIEVSHSNNKSGNRTNRYTGRENLTPQEALDLAQAYLRKYSTAIIWLCNKLEVCFIGIYDN